MAKQTICGLLVVITSLLWRRVSILNLNCPAPGHGFSVSGKLEVQYSVLSHVRSRSGEEAP